MRPLFKLSLKIILHLIFPALLFILTLEGLARYNDLFTGYPTAPTTKQPSFSSVTTDTDYGYLQVRPYSHWRHMDFNRYGFFDEDDYTTARTNNSLRILVIGDSVSFGIVDKDSIWVPKLQTLLADRHPNLKVEVINASNSINGLAETVTHLERRLLDFKPDVILLQELIDSKYLQANCTPLVEVKSKNLLTRSALFNLFYTQNIGRNGQIRLFVERLRNWQWPSFQAATTAPLNEYQAQLERLVAITQQAHIPLLLGNSIHFIQSNNYSQYPAITAAFNKYATCLTLNDLFTNFNRANRIVAAVAEQNETVYLVDSYRLLGDDPANYLVLKNDPYHPSADGGTILAHGFFAILEPILFKYK